MNKAFLYLRVSTENQEAGFSLEAQERLALEYAKRHNLDVVRIWKGSESAWGKTERPAFDEMVKEVKKNPDINNLIFDIADRMSRNERDKMLIYDLIHVYGKTIHFARTNKIYSKVSSPDDEFMLDMEVLIAKKMSNDISRKTKMGQIEKAEQGIYPSHVPLGYKNNPATKGVDIDNINAPFIKSLFERVASGNYSLRMLEVMLYEEGLRSQKTNGKVTKTTLHNIIHNPLYYGDFIWSGKQYKGTHEALVSKFLWDNASKKLAESARPHVTKRRFPFNSLIRCGKCGCTFGGGIYKKKYHLYGCSGSKEQHKRQFFNETEIATAFIPVLANISLPGDMSNWLKKGIKERFGRKAVELKSKEAQLREHFNKTYNELSKWYQLKSECEMHPKIFAERETLLKSKLNELENSLRACSIKPEISIPEATKTLDVLKELNKKYANGTNSQKVEILKLIATGYTMVNKKIVPIYREPFNIVAEGYKNNVELGNNADKSLKKEVWGG